MSEDKELVGVSALLNSLAKIRKLHSPTHFFSGEMVCDACGVEYPCPTMRCIY